MHQKRIWGRLALARGQQEKGGRSAGAGQDGFCGDWFT